MGRGRIDKAQERDSNETFYSIKSVEFLIIFLTAIGLSPGGSGYFTCIQFMKLVTNKFSWGASELVASEDGLTSIEFLRSLYHQM